MNWMEEDNCPVCGSKDKKVYGYGHIPVIRIPDVLIGCPLEVLTCYDKCNSCGLVFQNPHMDTEGVMEFYSSGTYRKLINVSSIQTMEEDESRGQIAWSDMVPSGRHLDIGCSHGLMLDLTRLKGCMVLGVEPNKEYIKPGIPSASSIYEVDGEWDYITCKHVLEHVPDVVQFSKKVIELLAPGGLLFLEVPAEGGPGSDMRLAHLYQFTPEVIYRLFDGLKLEEYKTNPHHFFAFRKVKNESKTD